MFKCSKILLDFKFVFHIAHDLWSGNTINGALYLVAYGKPLKVGLEITVCKVNCWPLEAEISLTLRMMHKNPCRENKRNVQTEMMRCLMGFPRHTMQIWLLPNSESLSYTFIFHAFSKTENSRNWQNPVFVNFERGTVVLLRGTPFIPYNDKVNLIKIPSSSIKTFPGFFPNSASCIVSYTTWMTGRQKAWIQKLHINKYIDLGNQGCRDWRN